MTTPQERLRSPLEIIYQIYNVETIRKAIAIGVAGQKGIGWRTGLLEIIHQIYNIQAVQLAGIVGVARNIIVIGKVQGRENLFGNYRIYSVLQPPICKIPCRT